MENFIVLLMAPINQHGGGSSSISTLIMFFIILAIPLSWVIPYIVRKNRNNQPKSDSNVSKTRNQIEQLKDLAELKEKGVLTEEEFIAQKNKVLGRENN